MYGKTLSLRDSLYSFVLRSIYENLKQIKQSFTIGLRNVESRRFTFCKRTKCSLREPILAYKELEVCQICGKFNTGLCQKLNISSSYRISIENPLAPLARFKETPLIQNQEPIEKQARNFDSPNGQRGYINSKENCSLALEILLQCAGRNQSHYRRFFRNHIHGSSP